MSKTWPLTAWLILFVTLKLTGVIDWSWWWVLSPMWGGALLWMLLEWAIKKGKELEE
jgi:hypothetical protein